MFEALQDTEDGKLFDELRRRGFVVVGFHPKDAKERFNCSEDHSNMWFGVLSQELEDEMTQRGWDFLDMNWRHE